MLTRLLDLKCLKSRLTEGFMKGENQNIEISKFANLIKTFEELMLAIKNGNLEKAEEIESIASLRSIFKDTDIALIDVKANEHLKQGDLAEAIELYKFLILMDQGKPKSWFGLSICYFKQKNLALANQVISIVNRLCPEEPLPYFIAAVINAKMKNTYEAEERLQDCIRVCTTSEHDALKVGAAAYLKNISSLEHIPINY
jgi:tetratricopeptide (TPR) repeat protein